MMIATSELTGSALDWAVAQCEGISTPEFLALMRDTSDNGFWQYHFSTDPAQAVPIIEREKISVLDANGCWAGRKTFWDNARPSIEHYGRTPLEAAMRCWVAIKRGDVVDVPEELLQAVPA